ncbi:carboxymuconolactone decarboxylase family protein [Phyllobacterium sp. SB3]|uniref:carboxymuconolactone decarboxylase family protein n=1 Tax=Phyllobacterium sp. SB3 TaxID=3156073 RepID=UPI0032AFAD3A
MSRRSTGQRALREIMGPEGENLIGAAESDTFGAAIAGFAVDHAFGEIWTRPGLDRKARSLITLTVMVALKQPDEFAIHMRAGLRNGLTLVEIEETMVQALPYVGFPAVSTALAAAAKVIEQDKLDQHSHDKRDRSLL